MFWGSELRSTKRSNSLDNRSMSYTQNHTQNSDLDSQINQIKKNNINKQLADKVNKFISINKAHQIDQVCVCQDCIYAKNLNRYQLLKLDMSKHSSYRQQYNKNHLLKRNLSNSVDMTASNISRKLAQSPHKNPYVHIDSSYKNQFSEREMDKIQKPKPTDQLKFAGPLPKTSLYKREYPGLNGPSQYLQMIKEQLLPSRKFNSNSIYSQSFKGVKLVQNQSAKMNDQLKLGKPSVVKQSTNHSLYSSPNPQTYSLRDRYLNTRQKRIQTPNLSFQYKTINRDQFEKPIQKKNCRSKRMQVLYGQLLTSLNNDSYMTIS